MRLQRIYSSKLYLTSSRKDRIHAAINSPYNQPLVQQLEEYLDEEAQVELKRAKSEIPPSDTPDSSGEVIQPLEDENFSGGGGSFGGAPSGGGPSFSGDVFQDFGEDELADVEPMSDDDTDSAPEEPVEENTAIMGKVMATSLIWTTVEDVVKECDIIQGTLNAREDTKGVLRLQVKDNELWIYYKDDVNLNDTMISVIETLNSTGYTYLAFSRLARSNNAIVFDITLNADENIKSINDVEKEK